MNKLIDNNMDIEVPEVNSGSLDTVGIYNDIKQNETSNEYDYGTGTNMDKDPENFTVLSNYSNSVSFDLDDEVKYVEGQDLIKDCPYCYTPFKKRVANLKGYDLIVFLFVSMMLPFAVRFTFLSSYINYTESQPTLRSVSEGKILFFSGALLSSVLLLGEVFRALKFVVEAIDKKRVRTPVEISDEMRLHKGRFVIKATKSGFPLWTTKNNKLANMRPLSFLKWSHRLTFSEFLLHIVMNLRWMTSISIFLGGFITTSTMSIVFSRNVNNSFFYLFAMHLSNGVVFPLFAYYAIKFIILLIWNGVKSFQITRRGKVMEEPLKTRTGKILLTRPVFAFLTDSCPCNYAVDKSSQLPKLYRYSIRYHCVFNGMIKNAFVYLLVFFTAFNTVVTILSLTSKMGYVSLYKI